MMSNNLFYKMSFIIFMIFVIVCGFLMFCYVLFADINECSLLNITCGFGSVCVNTDGSYKCECKTGYTGDGKSCSGNIGLLCYNCLFHFIL